MPLLFHKNLGENHTVTFLQNTWYMAAWTKEITREPLGRIMLGKPLVFYRTQAGKPIALGDICPHRFAPLHKGKLNGDAIECPYHGLRFSPEGQCVHSPFRDTPPKVANTSHYPMVEQNNIVWIWMGEPSLATTTPVPDHSELEEQEGIGVQVGGYLHVESNYRLVADNLLDLSHAEFLHPSLSNPGSVSRTHFDSFEKDGAVVAHSYIKNDNITDFFQMLWEGEAPKKIDMILNVHWKPPATMRLDIEAKPLDGNNPTSLKTSGPHIITPETQDSCHYFFGNSGNMNLNSPMMKNIDPKVLGLVFEQEDVPIIEAQQQYIQFAKEQGLTMRLQAFDKAAYEANKQLDKLIANEQ